VSTIRFHEGRDYRTKRLAKEILGERHMQFAQEGMQTAEIAALVARKQ